MTVLTLKWWTQKDKHNKQKKSIKFSDEFKSLIIKTKEIY